jgi:small subunit ribosomal protein S20
LANHKSALKRARQNEVRRLRNKIVKTRIKNATKAVRLAAETKTDGAVDQLNTTKSIIAQAAKKGVIHKQTASRKISRLTRLVNKITA